MFDSHKYYPLTFQYPQFLKLYTGRMLSKCYLDLHLRLLQNISKFSIHVNCRLIENWKISPQCGTRIILNLKVFKHQNQNCDNLKKVFVKSISQFHIFIWDNLVQYIGSSSTTITIQFCSSRRVLMILLRALSWYTEVAEFKCHFRTQPDPY